MCRVDRFGFPRTTAKSAKRVKGFQTGDLVKAVVTEGKKLGTYFGRVAVRSSGYFNIYVKGKVVQGVSHKYCKLMQRQDGYSYAVLTKSKTEEPPLPTHSRRFSPKGSPFPPSPKGKGFQGEAR
jgi:hypothetical protein